MLIPLIAPFIALPVITTGPAYAGITYILRNYSREEHAFIGSDFKEHALKNFRQSSIVSIVNTLLFVIMLTGIKVYSAMITESFLWTFPMGILFVITSYSIHYTKLYENTFAVLPLHSNKPASQDKSFVRKASQELISDVQNELYWGQELKQC